MKKKLLAVALILALTVALSVGLAACDKAPDFEKDTVFRASYDQPAPGGAEGTVTYYVEIRITDAGKYDMYRYSTGAPAKCASGTYEVKKDKEDYYVTFSQGTFTVSNATATEVAAYVTATFPDGLAIKCKINKEEKGIIKEFTTVSTHTSQGTIVLYLINMGSDATGLSSGPIVGANAKDLVFKPYTAPAA